MLLLLLEHAGEVISREQIRENLWPSGTVVDFDHGIATALKKLRRALNDDAAHPRFIETLARRGYRWIAGAEWVEAGAPSKIPDQLEQTNELEPEDLGDGLAEEILHAVTHILGRRTADTSRTPELNIRRAADITIFEISGHLKLGAAVIPVEDSLRRLIDEGARKVVINLAGLKTIDSSGIGLLVTSSGHIDHKGGQMRIAGAQGTVAKALAIARMDRIAPLDTDVDSSCRRLSEGAGL